MVSGLSWHEQGVVRRGMWDGRHATRWLLPLRCAFPATGEIDGQVSPDSLVGGQRPHFREMLGLKLLALGGASCKTAMRFRLDHISSQYSSTVRK